MCPVAIPVLARDRRTPPIGAEEHRWGGRKRPGGWLRCRPEAVPSGQCRLEAVPSGQCRGTPPASGNPTAGVHRGARALSTRTQHLVPQGRCGDLQRCPFLLVTPSAANHFILCPRRCRASPFVGFVVERIAEPRPSSEMVARHPELAQAPMRPLFVVYRRCLVAH